ncbi:hypothetical protein AVEN_208458-1 [Araneus ventricosus]|uniref:Uncharacterized protein n=1 Tax=Araneus ventricosus TaxID=182803 RepID=A0A4Y2P7T2_ARAVE|nr:hypothetical protein AVEN_208458-1 [Araneus ventricosus]
MKQGQEDMQSNILIVISTKLDAIVEKNEERLGKVEGKFHTIEDKFRHNSAEFGDTGTRNCEKYLKDYSRLQLKTRQQRPNETLQELTTDVERLSHLAFSDFPTEVRETLSVPYFIDGVRDSEIQKALRMVELASCFSVRNEVRCRPAIYKKGFSCDKRCGR